MDFLVNLNLLVLILIIVTAFKMVDGYKKGMVKEIISFVSIIIACMVVALIANGTSLSRYLIEVTTVYPYETLNVV